MKRITALYNILSLYYKQISKDQKSPYKATYPLHKNKMYITSSPRYYAECGRERGSP